MTRAPGVLRAGKPPVGQDDFGTTTVGQPLGVPILDTAVASCVLTNLATVSARRLATRSARATIVIVNPTPTFTG